MRTHTRADGSFVDQKAKQVAEHYEKTLEEKLSEIDDDGPETSSENSTQRTLSIGVKNEIFLMCTETDEKGNPFGLGSLVETLKKGKRKQAYESSSSSTVLELQEQLRRNMAHHEAENARREEEHRQTQMQFQKLFLYMKGKDPEFASFLVSSPTVPATTADTTPAATGQPATAPATVTSTEPAAVTGSARATSFGTTPVP
ncbi:uncharacterized protein LOC111828576 isoform X2 [Capsella rubella]|nr:uncharacterized protein LOC111828576 isoform X2 [Capsella rubella]XP_023632623.1 uncharacterized protein LOC111828576 isoform X2 [Capsella rubella]